MIVEWAPAKLNLYLHVTGKRDDHYHLLDSLVSFADYGDVLQVQAADSYSLTLDGPFAGHFTGAERDAENIVTRAVHLLAKALGRPPHVAVRLTKNLPVAAGIGGGSADAAAVIRALLRLWQAGPAQPPDLARILLSLGADVPVCFYNRAALIEGIGEKIRPVDDLPEMAALLVNPLLPCRTAEIFARLKPPYGPAAGQAGLRQGAWDEFLPLQRNDLYQPARAVMPEIDKVMAALQAQPGCLWARMSGSGATCFGIYKDFQAAQKAALILFEAEPDWWVCPTLLNSG